MYRSITMQTRDPDLIAALQTMTPPAGVNLNQEQHAAASTDGLVEVAIHHTSVAAAAIVTAWLWPLLEEYDCLLLITRPFVTATPAPDAVLAAAAAGV